MKQSKVKLIVVSLVSTLLLSIATISLAGPFHGKHVMGNPLERMLDHIDLTDQQELEIAEILTPLSKGKKHKRGFQMLKDMIEVNPDDSDFLTQANERAELAGEMLTKRLKAAAKARKDIYLLLTPEQKQELEKMLKRKINRISKHIEEH